MIVDVHTHIWPEEDMSPKLINAMLAGRRKRALRGDSVDPLLLTKLQSVSNDQLVLEYEEAGYDKVIVLADDSSRLWQSKVRDESVKEFVDRYPDLLVGYSSVEPIDENGHFKKQAVKDVEKAVTEYGFKGLKLVPPAAAYFPNDKTAYPLYYKCQELNIPIIFHISGEKPPVSIAYASVWRMIEALDDVAFDFPDLRVVIAHFGGGEEALKLAQRHDNVFIEFSAGIRQPGLLTHNLILAKEYHLLDRLMYGTDGPGNPQPAKYYVNWMKNELNEMAKRMMSSLSGKSVTFTQDEINGMLGDNAMRIMKW